MEEEAMPPRLLTKPIPREATDRAPEPMAPSPELVRVEDVDEAGCCPGCCALALAPAPAPALVLVLVVGVDRYCWGAGAGTGAGAGAGV